MLANLIINLVLIYLITSSSSDDENYRSVNLEDQSGSDPSDSIESKVYTLYPEDDDDANDRSWNRRQSSFNYHPSFLANFDDENLYDDQNDLYD
ncbi:hypothetical protein QR98_0091150 [Sarcoptes scabiei]|uniref:Secreted protein n=1 Tax=Sarcoptes scabiei TaxID=52283 RepID=A0A132AI06_SARSC|nr:hypothetical protein QR98_0091150 [Sarcoptes scabiei]